MFALGNEYSLFELESATGALWIQPGVIKWASIKHGEPDKWDSASNPDKWDTHAEPHKGDTTGKQFLWKCPPTVQTLRLKLEVREKYSGGSSEERAEEMLIVHIIEPSHETLAANKMDWADGKEGQQVVMLFIIALVCATLIMALITLSIVVCIRIQRPHKKPSSQMDALENNVDTLLKPNGESRLEMCCNGENQLEMSCIDENQMMIEDKFSTGGGN